MSYPTPGERAISPANPHTNRRHHEHISLGNYGGPTLRRLAIHWCSRQARRRRSLRNCSSLTLALQAIIQPT